jgi:hypothetical protein
MATDECRSREPLLAEREPGHWMACHRHAELPAPLTTP